MKCTKVLSRLNAYADRELAGERRRAVADHLEHCHACRAQFERIRQVEDLLDTMAIPAVPEGLAGRIMARARSQAALTTAKKPFLAAEWLRLRWFKTLSAPMRLVACALVLLAFFFGLTMSREVSLSGTRPTTEARVESLEGLEWFSATPPDCLTSTYLSLASTAFDDGGAPR
jgi:anti-sigma factor RsiW